MAEKLCEDLIKNNLIEDENLRRRSCQKFFSEKIREQLEEYASKVDENLREADRLCEEGVETLTPEQFHSLKECQQKLRSTYTEIIRQTDAILDRLDLATALLIEFSTKSSQLQSWIFDKSRDLNELRMRAGDLGALAETKRLLKALDKKIAGGAANLKVISQLAARINVEICNYIDELRKRELSVNSAHFAQLDRHQINETVERIQEDYDALVRSKTELSHFLNRLRSVSTQYEEDLSRVTSWLSDLEEVVFNTEVKHSDSEKQLSRLIHLKQSTVENQSKIDAFNNSSRQLVEITAGTDAHDNVQAEQADQVSRIRTRYENINEKLSDSINEIRGAITQREGLRESLQKMSEWLKEAENTMLESRPLPLNLLKLNEFKYENQLKYSELTSNKKTLDDLSLLLERVPAAQAADLAETYGTTKRRLERLDSGVNALNENLLDLIDALNEVQEKSTRMNEEQALLTDFIAALDPTNAEAVSTVEQRLTRLVVDEWNELERMAKRILQIPNVESSRPIDSLMKNIEAGLNRLQNAFKSKLSSGERILENCQKFNAKFEEVDAQLRSVEVQLPSLLQISLLDADLLVKLRGRGNQLRIDLNEVGESIYELDLLGVQFTQSVGSVTVASKRRSMDVESMIQNATGTNSEALSRITRQLFDLRKRRDDADRSLSHSLLKLSEAEEHRRDWDTQLVSLERWISNETHQLNQFKANDLTLAESKMNALQADLSAFGDRRRKKHAELASLQLKSQQLGNLLRYEFGVPGTQESRAEGGVNAAVGSGNEFELAIRQLENEWTSLEESTREMEDCVQLIRQFLQIEKALCKWLQVKTTMFTKLCGTLADLKLVDNHLMFIQMLELELSDEEQRWIKFNDMADALLRSADSKAFAEKIESNVNVLSEEWTSLKNGVVTRHAIMLAVQTLAADFESAQEKIRCSLINVGERVNLVANMSNDMEEERLQKLTLLDEAESTLKHECAANVNQMRQVFEEILRHIDNDAALRSNITNKIEAAERSVAELARKIELVRNATMSATLGNKELLGELDALHSSVQEKSAELEALSAPPIDSAKLADHAQRFNALYNEILTNEGKVIIIGSKVVELLKRSPNADVKQKLRDLNDDWQMLASAARRKRENIDAIHKALDDFESVMDGARQTLDGVAGEIEEFKKNETSNLNFTPIELKLHALEPKLEQALESLDQLLTLTTNGGTAQACSSSSSDLGKLKLHLEEMRQRRTEMLEDCHAFVDFLKKKNDLRNKFDADVKTLNTFLDTVRTEYKLSEEISDAERQAVGMAALKNGFDKFNSKWKQNLTNLTNVAGQLSKIADANENAEINEAIDVLELNADEIRKCFEETLRKMKEEENVLGEIEERGSMLNAKVTEFINNIKAVPSVGRDLATLKSQTKNTNELIRHLDANVAEVKAGFGELDPKTFPKSSAQHHSAQTLQRGFAQLLTQLDSARGDLVQRKRAIQTMEERVEQLDSSVNSVLAEMESAKSTEVFGGASSPALINITQLDDLRNQQGFIKMFKATGLKAIADKVNEITANCKELIRSASPDVSTQQLEESMQKVSEKWHELNKLVEMHEMRFDSAVQGLGSYNDAYSSLITWLEDTEQLINGQKAPSADHKVIKVQLQNHEFQMKLVNDKQSSVNGFLAMIDKIEALANSEDQKRQLRSKADEVSTRYSALVTSVDHHRQQLQDALTLTAEFSRLQQALSKFLDDSNKKLTVFSKIPTDAERLNEQIQLQKELQENTDRMRTEFDRLIEIYSEIVTFVSAEDANELEAVVRNLTSRYNDVGTRCRNCGQLLATLAEDITQFFNNANQLTEWLDVAEQEFEKLGQISTFPDELEAQSEALTRLAVSVFEQGELVSTVVKESRELCSHTSGSEAIALQYRIDCLRNRYQQLATEAEQKIAVLEKAIPLSGDLQEGFHAVREFLNGVEEDLENLDQVPLEEQFQLIETISADFVEYRKNLNELQSMCVDLQRLSCEEKANELAKESQEIVQRFNVVHDLVSKKLDQLKNADRQSRHTFDVLDFYIDWFHEIREGILQSEKPSVDIELLKAQLKQQRALNEEIANERAGLRNVVVDATRIARDLNSTLMNQDGGLVNKIEKTKKLADDTAELGFDRTAELEQALALCKELDETYTELNDWMDNVEEELCGCQPITTGLSPKDLIQQQLHNNSMLQAVQAQRPIVGKFERNIVALSELCSPTDSTNLRQIADQVLERFNDLANGFRERGDALASTIEQSSEFTDRLNMFLANLEGAVNQIRNSEPPSARPVVLRQQLSDNMEILELVKEKEAIFRAMKSNAHEVLSQAKDNETAVREITQSIDTLDSLWSELQSGASARHALLTECLRRADAFWAQYEQCQTVLTTLGQRLDSIQLDAAASPEHIAANQEQLRQINASLSDSLAHDVEGMRASGGELCTMLTDDDERAYVEQHFVLFDNNWKTFMELYGQLSASLVDAMEKSSHFHDTFEQLAAWLTQLERRVEQQFGGVELPSSVELIETELAQIDEVRRELNDRALHREQLTNAAAEFCAAAQPANAAIVRNSMNDLNQRWNRVGAALADRLQKLERTMLEMGQFAQAHDQFSLWMEKANATLGTINPRPDSLKQVEIELCKFHVVHSDIETHAPSFEAIQQTRKIASPQLAALADRWYKLCLRAEAIGAELEACNADLSRRSNELEKWAIWLSDLLTELKSSKPVGGLPETAQVQLDDFSIMAADVEQRRDELEVELAALAARVAQLKDERSIAAEENDETRNTDEEKNGDGSETVDDSNVTKRRKRTSTVEKYGDDVALLEKRHAQLQRDWDLVQKKLVDREAQLRNALREAIELQSGIYEISEWLTDAGNALSLAPAISRLPEPLKEQLDAHAIFNENVQQKRGRMKELHNKCESIQLICEKKDAIPIKNKLISLKHAVDKVVLRNAERTRALEAAASESQLYFESRDELVLWIDASQVELENSKAQAPSSTSSTGCRVRDLLAAHKEFQDRCRHRASDVEVTLQHGRALEEHAPVKERRTVASMNEELLNKWETLQKSLLERQRSLEEALVQSGKFEEVMAEMLDWLDECVPRLEADVRSECQMGDVDTVHALLADHYKEVTDVLKAKRPNLYELRKRAAQIADGNEGDEAEVVEMRRQMADVDDKWKRLEVTASKKEELLTKALTKAVDLSENLHEFNDFVADTETRLRRLVIPSEKLPVEEELKRLAALRGEIGGRAAEYQRILELARHIHANCHPHAELPMRNLIRSLTGRWELLNQLVEEKQDKLKMRLTTIEEHEKMLNELLDYVEEKKAELGIMAASEDNEQLSQLLTLIGELGMFKSELENRKSDVDEAIRTMKRTAANAVHFQQQQPKDGDEKSASSGGGTPSKRVAPKLKQQQSMSSLAAAGGSAISAAAAGSSSAEAEKPSPRQQKTDRLAENWRNLWQEASNYEKQLEARRAHLEELKRLEAFTFADWRERYLAWNDHGKARISDLFRRIDKSGTGVVPRKLFIDGILASKFPTTPLEMGKVADEFDKGDGMISAKEFMNALRFDPKKRKYESKTETERIHEEISRETSRCRCAHRFPIQQIISEDKDRVQYGFGFGSTMKRMVRILRSTVMVRVGGGWEALDEFLLKHDPCRAKGRLNVEMFENRGHRMYGSGLAIDQMASFTARKNSAPPLSPSLSSASSVAAYASSGGGCQLGPIMKIREKTERSMPMFRKPSTPKSPTTSSLFSTPIQQPRRHTRRGSNDLMLDGSSSSHIPRPVASESGSRYGSRQNLTASDSRPASRCSSDILGSDLLLSDGQHTPTRIPSLRGAKSGRRK